MLAPVYARCFNSALRLTESNLYLVPFPEQLGICVGSNHDPTFRSASRFVLLAFYHPTFRLASLPPLCAVENVGCYVFGSDGCQVSVVPRKQITGFARNVDEAATYVAQQICEGEESSSRRFGDSLDLTFYFWGGVSKTTVHSKRDLTCALPSLIGQGGKPRCPPKRRGADHNQKIGRASCRERV